MSKESMPIIPPAHRPMSKEEIQRVFDYEERVQSGDVRAIETKSFSPEEVEGLRRIFPSAEPESPPTIRVTIPETFRTIDRNISNIPLRVTDPKQIDQFFFALQANRHTEMLTPDAVESLLLGIVEDQLNANDSLPSLDLTNMPFIPHDRIDLFIRELRADTMITKELTGDSIIRIAEEVMN